ncbi:hypothetical protein HPB48_012199 [Haemaphysalis longicornis]|uniref:DDE Tnp4 domain-containing protein n=1 Tax=Haemaphysalis longicornis TaxID=44386 RepID=A0A9J6FBJ0_HAELO|nr:hypothetical protein HPB48_012199 [Haemaphysalis longicornis]
MQLEAEAQEAKYEADAVEDWMVRMNGVILLPLPPPLCHQERDSEDRSVAIIFAVGRSTVNSIYREFAKLCRKSWETEWIGLPTAQGMTDHMREFAAVCDFPNAVGAMDGCHFPVSPPKEHASDYITYKGWHSMILLAFLDHRYRFRFVNVGSPCRCHDAYVDQRSQLGTTVEGPLFRAP